MPAAPHDTAGLLLGPPDLDPADRTAEVARRLESVRALLAERRASAALLATRRDFAWLTLGGQNHVVLATEDGAAPLLVTQEGAVVLAPNIEAERLALEELAGLPIEVASLPWHDAGSLELEVRRRTADPEAVLGDADLKAALLPLRSRLSDPEHRRLAWLGALVKEALGSVLAGVRVGGTELGAAARLVSELTEHGLRLPVLLAAADERIARYRHPLPSDAPIRARLMLVVVGERWGLHVAATGFRELRPPDADLVRRIEAADTVLHEMAAATRPGATLGDVFAAAQRAYARAGVPEEWRDHHQGGTIGYRGRERIAVPGDPTTIEAGMAFAWNPSVAGAKSERTYLLGDDGRLVAVT